jgi:hypothetical protein
MSYLPHTNDELQNVINGYVDRNNLSPKSIPAQSKSEVLTQEEKDWEACKQYIIENQSTLIPGSSFLVVEKGVVTPYPNFPTAYPHIKGRGDLFEYQYQGWPPKPVRIRKVVRQFTPEDVCLYTPVKVWYQPLNQQTDHSLDDVVMLVDTGAGKSLGPRSVLTNLGVNSQPSGMCEGFDRSIHKTKSIKVELEIEGKTPSKSIRIPVFIDYLIPEKVDPNLQPDQINLVPKKEPDEKFELETINTDRTDKDEWLLGMDFLKYCRHVWEDTTKVTFEVSDRYQNMDGTFNPISKN